VLGLVGIQGGMPTIGLWWSRRDEHRPIRHDPPPEIQRCHDEAGEHPDG
jgi:hypothetical protein